MKRLFPIWAILGALLLVIGCSKSDGYFNREEPGPEPKPDDEPTEQFESLCKQVNTNIASLQALVAAMQEGDYVKAVIPITQETKEKSKDKEIGYTITFEERDSITIYLGTESDTTGNGAMPIVSVRQDEDSIYYWTLNDDWLLDDAGNKTTAQSAPPKLKLENGYWCVSCDGEQTWQQFREATDADCDKTFQSVTQDDNNVYILLASGEKITLRKPEPDDEPEADNEPIELVVQITEQDTLLQFRDNETRTIHYTITGDTANLVVKAEMQNDDGGYTLQTTPTSKTTGAIEIQAKTPTENRVIISVSDGHQTVQTNIAVSAAPFDGQTVQVETPGTLSQLLADYDLSTITKLRITGSINDEDIATLNALPNLSVLDLEDTDLTVLPSNAFKDNKTLISMKLPQGLATIGNSAFFGCSNLTENLTIPEGVTTIGSYAFRGCSSLMGDLTIPEGVTTIGSYAFHGCSSLTGDLTIPKGVTTIELATFEYCSGLTGTLTIPEGVTTIGWSAFYGCSGLTGDLTIPNSVTKIGTNAFYGCSGLTGNLTIPNSVTTIEGWAFYGCSGLTGDLTIPEGMTEIKSRAFSDCSGLTGNLTIPNSVTKIGTNAFYGCSGLTGNLTIPNSVTTIEGWAFSGCSGLTSITIPESVTEIGQYASESCSSLTQIECKSTTPPQLGSNAFSGVSTSNCTLSVPTGCEQAYRTADGWKSLKFKNIIETEF